MFCEKWAKWLLSTSIFNQTQLCNILIKTFTAYFVYFFVLIGAISETRFLISLSFVDKNSFVVFFMFSLYVYVEKIVYIPAQDKYRFNWTNIAWYLSWKMYHVIRLDQWARVKIHCWDIIIDIHMQHESSYHSIIWQQKPAKNEQKH